ncbi:cytochrome P450 [Halorubrum sp. CBA1125]|uniref:cytochrome P450 n=1 Tax=Halorubrum sp. CBA1125 TaxID=2668072 RepID=UPI0012E93FBE|nr:cytochrome P450 [Halorubrum sp. CBA1125]MUW15009.1 cytochrome P450 [Halorubrum sp. CBA1125]
MGTEQGGEPSGPSGLPVVGNIYQFASDPLSFYEEVAREYGPIARYKLGGTEFYQLSDPELVERVLVHQNDKFRKGEEYRRILNPVIGNGLLISEGEFWRQQRHQMQPAFHPEALADYAPIIVDYTRRLLADWRDDTVRDIHADMMQLTVEIIAKTLFDVDIRDYEANIADALEAVMDRSEKRLERPIDIPDSVPTPGNRRYKRALSALYAIATEIVEAHDVDGDDVVSRLLRAKSQVEGLDDEQIQDEVVTLLLAGHETTALALTYTLYLLATNPEQADRLGAELDENVNGGPPSRDVIEDLPYTKRTIREGMRVYPPVQSVIREATEPVELGGYEFAEGTAVTVQQWVLHRDPRFYERPDAFRPERWSEEFRDSLPRFAYFPFGGGPRRCIGENFAKLEARLVLATIAQECEFEAVTDELSLSPSITLRPDGAVKLRVRRR